MTKQEANEIICTRLGIGPLPYSELAADPYPKIYVDSDAALRAWSLGRKYFTDIHPIKPPKWSYRLVGLHAEYADTFPAAVFLGLCAAFGLEVEE